MEMEHWNKISLLAMCRGQREEEGSFIQVVRVEGLNTGNMRSY